MKTLNDKLNESLNESIKIGSIVEIHGEHRTVTKIFGNRVILDNDIEIELSDLYNEIAINDKRDTKLKKLKAARFRDALRIQGTYTDRTGNIFDVIIETGTEHDNEPRYKTFNNNVIRYSEVLNNIKRGKWKLIESIYNENGRLKNKK